MQLTQVNCIHLACKDACNLRSPVCAILIAQGHGLIQSVLTEVLAKLEITIVGCAHVQVVTLQEGSQYEQTGIVLVHGFGAGVFAWRHIMQPLAQKCSCRVVAFDRPGFGKPFQNCIVWNIGNGHASCSSSDLQSLAILSG